MVAMPFRVLAESRQCPIRQSLKLKSAIKADSNIIFILVIKKEIKMNTASIIIKQCKQKLINIIKSQYNDCPYHSIITLNQQYFSEEIG